MDNSAYTFQLAFEGDKLEHSVDAFELANTILATSQILQEIGEIQLGPRAKESLHININAFKQGSFVTDFSVALNQMSVALPVLLPAIGHAYTVGKGIFQTYKTIVEVKKFLGGNPPLETRAVNTTTIQITNNGQMTMNIDYNSLRALQDKGITKNLEKMIEPLTRINSETEYISLKGEDEEELTITRQEAQFFGAEDDFQIVDKVRYKGTVSKLDTKVCSGYIDVGSRRLPFTYSLSLPIDQFDILVESLRTKVQIYLIGNVKMDFESNPKSLDLVEVQSDLKLLDAV